MPRLFCTKPLIRCSTGCTRLVAVLAMCAAFLTAVGSPRAVAQDLVIGGGVYVGSGFGYGYHGRRSSASIYIGRSYYRPRSYRPYYQRRIYRSHPRAYYPRPLAPRRVYRAPSRIPLAKNGLVPFTPQWIAYCARKFKSFDARSGTYLAYSGKRRYCR
ncbi:BA14K family protein [Roseibium sp. TrichSKD4]|uniref:BA14K family protein n=1 Tax=Roseibium sp. TrichSKD4 TaxID=744980 RepID=UPI000A0519AD|nr:BA14K family protein [Roseibium sp. TrichSKD4]